MTGSLHQFSKKEKGGFFYTHTEPIGYRFKHSYKRGKNAETNWFGESVELLGWCDRGRHCTMTGANLNYKWYWAKSEETQNETTHNLHNHFLRAKNSRNVVPNSR